MEMGKRTAAAVLILLFAGMLILIGVETAAKSLGGTPLMILCYVIIGAALGGYLLKMKGEEVGKSKNEGGPEESFLEKESSSEKISEACQSENRKGENDEDL